LVDDDTADPPIALLQVSIKSSRTCCFPSWRDDISSKSLQSTTTRIHHSRYIHSVSLNKAQYKHLMP